MERGRLDELFSHCFLFCISVLSLVACSLALDCELADETWNCQARGINAFPTFSAADGYFDTILIHQNNIPAITQDTFANLDTVVKINLGSNKITEIPAFCFSLMPLIADLNLQKNDITTIDDDAFQGVPGLKYLDLSFNELTSFPLAYLDAVPEH